MKFNKIIMVSLLLLIIFSISAASAAQDDNITQISDDEVIEISDNDNLGISDENNEIIKEDSRSYLDFDISISKEIMNYNQGEYIHIKNLPDDYTGQIRDAKIDGENHDYVGLTGTGVEVDFTQLSVGLHNITITTTETDKYLQTSKTAYFNVSAVSVTIPAKIIVGSDQGIGINAPFAKSGTVVVKVDGKDFKTVDLSKVTANFNTKYKISLDSLSYPATHSVEVISTTGNYQTIKRANVSISGYDILISVVGTGTYGSGANNNWITYNGAKNRIEVILPPGAKNKPNVTIDGVPYACAEETDYCYTTHISSLGLGMHTVTVSYKDSKYHHYEVSEKFEVRAYITYPATTDYTSGAAVSLTLPENATGNLKVYLSDTYINYENESKLYNSVKMENGTASIPISYLNPGKYYIHTVYDGSDYDVEAKSGALTIEMKCIYPNKMTYGEDKSITVISSPDDNTTLKYYLNGQAHILQLVNGTGTIPLKDAPIREMLDIPIYYNESMQGVENDYIKMITIRVNPATKLTGAKDISMYYADGSKYSVKVYGIYGNVVGAGQKITFKVGTTRYVKETNSKGIATLVIPKLPGTYKISATYKTVTVKNTLTVKKVLTLKAVTVKKSARKLILSATLKKGKKAIKNTKVTFKFNGKTYSAKTNSKGIAKYTIKKSVLKKLKVGKKVKYQVTYKKCTVKRTATVKG